MSKLARVNLVTEASESDTGGDLLNNRRLSELVVPLRKLKNFSSALGGYTLYDPVLQAAPGADLKPWFIRVSGPKVVGYTFFEKMQLERGDISAAKEYFDWLVAGSTWCESILKECGLRRSSTIPQGIDASRFHIGCSEKKRFKDQFVVFSGGKMELRKGQDLVIRAFKVFQDKHDDVLLVNSWYNMWDESTMTMGLSPYIRFDMPKGDYFRAINRLLHANGIDPQKVVTLPPKPHDQMPEIYRNSDCGLFPNRLEGGTNLVLMEYMACGKPAIASFSSGHKDVLNLENCIPIKGMKKMQVRDPDGSIMREWDDPDLDEIIDKLEWAYHNRDELKKIGNAAARSMEDMTWEKAARKFKDLFASQL